ncbi:uncharacterized protein LOC127277183 [Leptopilina boulardi]|uniref:uncharacterized protein LOC127277183 n=1 Tax=Leptopilina boulardi TaxID=63433 RepID=UPI0021F63837|nr:uncharacterized protein LOC127277183 [Leptopilina boulardi]
MKFCTLLLLCVGIFVVSGQPCKPEGSFCFNNRECCFNLQCSIWDNRCLRPGACRNIGQYCINDSNCCPSLFCHPTQRRCDRVDLCQRVGQLCLRDGFERCCPRLTCRNSICSY